MINIGTLELADAYVGSTPIKKAYIGSQLVWEKNEPGMVEIEYLQGTGTQYIDTGLKPDNTYTFDTKVAVTQSSYNCVYWGCRSSGTYTTNNRQCYLNSNTSQSNARLKRINLFSTNANSTTNWDSGITPATNTMYTLTGMTVVSTMATMTYPIVLFGLNNIGSISKTKCRIGLFTAYSNGVKVMDLVPVRIGQVGYMYDKVSDTLFGNAGTGSFTLGPDVT